jgi:hypothetical protein
MSLSVLKVKATEGSKANCPFPSFSSRYFFPLVLLVSYYVSENRKSSFLLLFIVCQLFLLHLLAYRLLLCVFYILSVCISAFRNCVFSYLLLSRTSSCWICILHFCPTRISKTEESLEKVIKKVSVCHMTNWEWCRYWDVCWWQWRWNVSRSTKLKSVLSFPIPIIAQVVQCLRQWVADLPTRRPAFNPGLIHVRFMVDEVALGQVLLRALRLSPISIPWTLFHSLISSVRCRRITI